MSIDKSWLDELRARLSIAAVAGRRLTWDRHKTNARKGDYWACCPFHAEKTPSFHVDDRKGFFHCFGCGESGDAITLVRKMEGCTFGEALEKLAAEAGLPLPPRAHRNAGAQKRERNARDALEAACRYYRSQLVAAGGREARRYLEGRAIGEAAIAHFEIGYAPASASEGGQGLLPHLRESGFGQQTLREAGILAESASGQWRERFRNRIIFPIRDARGNSAGFGGRALGQGGGAKYLNSPETAFFHKGKMLYNLHHARAVREGELIVVEGYLDVIALHQAGFSRVVSPLGTALTEAHMALAWRVADEPVLMFDGDNAGTRAASRAIDTALPLLAPGKSLRFAFLPEGRDPDDLVRAGGAGAVRRVLDNATPMVRALCERERMAAPHDTPERMAALSQRLHEAVRRIGDPAIRLPYLDAVRAALHALRDAQFETRHRAWRKRRNAPREGRYVGTPSDPDPTAPEAVLLATVINHPALASKHAADLAELNFGNAEFAALRTTILDAICSAGESTQERRACIESRAQPGLVARLLRRGDVCMTPFAQAGAAPDEAERGAGEILSRMRREQMCQEEVSAACEAMNALPPGEADPSKDSITPRLKETIPLRFRNEIPTNETQDLEGKKKIQRFFDEKLWIRKKRKRTPA